MKIKDVTLIIKTEDGKKITASVLGLWSQWGARTETLGETVELVEAVSETVNEHVADIEYKK